MLGALITPLLTRPSIERRQAESALAAASITMERKASCEYRSMAPSPPRSRLFGASNRIASRLPCAPSNGLGTKEFRATPDGCLPWQHDLHKLGRCMVEPFHPMLNAETVRRASNSSVACGAAPFRRPGRSALSYTVFHVRTQATIRPRGRTVWIHNERSGQYGFSRGIPSERHGSSAYSRTSRT